MDIQYDILAAHFPHWLSWVAKTFSLAGAFPASMLLGFSTPQMPIGSAPTSPSVSADAERQRQAAAQAAQIDATASGRSSTVHGGTDIAYAKQAGRALMRGGVSQSMGL